MSTSRSYQSISPSSTKKLLKEFSNQDSIPSNKQIASPTVDFFSFNDMKTIGMGSFSTVYSAIWNDQEVAVKEMNINDCLDFGKSLNACLLEKDVMETLSSSSPYIVNYFAYAISLDMKKFRLVMESIPYDLQDAIHANQFENDFAWKTRLKIIWGVCQGLMVMHDQYQIVHCDLKSDNILLDQYNNPKICDFGQAHPISNNASNVEGFNCAWLAPEIVRRKPYTDKADMFSVATIIWEMSSSKFPFEELGLNEIYERKQKENLLEVIPTDCPKDISKLITLGWMEDPNKRPTAKLMGHYVEEFLSNKPLFVV